MRETASLRTTPVSVLPEHHVWIFNAGMQFPGGLLTIVERAEAWIGRHRLTGVLTAYRLEEGCFDWAVRLGIAKLRPETLVTNGHNPAFIGGFSTASQEHSHYVGGKRT